MKAIRTEVGSIKKVEGNWRLIKWYESHDDLKSKRQMDQKTRRQNMNSNFEENQNVEQKLYESPNMGTILKPRSLRTKKQPAWHWVSLIKIGARK